MKHFLQFIGLLLLVLIFGACQKNVDEFIPDAVQPAPDTEWKSVITANMPVISLKNDLRLTKATDSFSYNNTGIVYNPGTLSLGVPSNGLINSSGAFPMGNLVRQSLLIQKKGDLISMTMPTVSNGRLLISGGVFFTDLKHNNEQLMVAQGTSLSVKYNSSTPVPGMKVFNATDDIINGFNWIENTDITYNKVNISGNGYEVLTNKLQWVHAAYIFDTAGIAQTGFSLKLPENYTNANTVVYISFNEMQCVAPMAANVTQKKFVSGDLPINRQVTITVISKQANDYYLGVQQTATAVPSSGAGIQEITVTPVKTSFSALRSFLNGL